MHEPSIELAPFHHWNVKTVFINSVPCKSCRMISWCLSISWQTEDIGSGSPDTGCWGTCSCPTTCRRSLTSQKGNKRQKCCSSCAGVDAPVRQNGVFVLCSQVSLLKPFHDSLKDLWERVRFVHHFLQTINKQLQSTGQREADSKKWRWFLTWVIPVSVTQKSESLGFNSGFTYDWNVSTCTRNRTRSQKISGKIRNKST